MASGNACLHHHHTLGGDERTHISVSDRVHRGLGRIILMLCLFYHYYLVLLKLNLCFHVSLLHLFYMVSTFLLNLGRGMLGTFLHLCCTSFCTGLHYDKTARMEIHTRHCVSHSFPVAVYLAYKSLHRWLYYSVGRVSATSPPAPAPAPMTFTAFFSHLLQAWFIFVIAAGCRTRTRTPRVRCACSISQPLLLFKHCTHSLNWNTRTAAP